VARPLRAAAMLRCMSILSFSARKLPTDLKQKPTANDQYPRAVLYFAKKKKKKKKNKQAKAIKQARTNENKQTSKQVK
jgi:hypothetical protein